MKEMIYKPTREKEILAAGAKNNIKFVVISHGTHPCAYVGVPKTHKLFGKEIDDLCDIECHGGVTYADDNVINLDYTRWWIGWDYAHYGDYSGSSLIFDNHLDDDKKYTTEEMVKD